MSVTRVAPILPRSTEYVLGVDEVGLGAWAGPMCLGGVLARRDFHLKGLRDSKKMSEGARIAIIDEIYTHSIDTYGALRDACFILDNGQGEAWLSALEDVVIALLLRIPDISKVSIIVDGSENSAARRSLHTRFPKTPLFFCPKADDLVPQVAAASVMAKVYRDSLMVDLEQEYPGYMWAKNKGYGVPDHVAGLERLGSTEYHREHARKSWPIRTISS